MYSILISLGAGALVTILFGSIIGGPGISVGYGLIPGIITTVALWLYLGRRIGKKLEALMMRFQEEIQPKGMAKPDPKAIDRGIVILREGYKFKGWHIMVGAQIDGHVGWAYFSAKRFDEAKPYLEKATGRHWIAKAMLGVLYYKKKQHEQMKKTFQKTLKWARKESFYWNLYAYCLWKSGDRDGAIDILSKGLEVLKDDERIESNRLALQKKKKMKMRGWDSMWYQFHLDTPPMPKMKMDRRQVYRGR